MNAWTNIVLKQKHMEKRRIKSENIKENDFNCVIVAEKRKSSTITTFKNQDKDTKNPILIRMQQIKWQNVFDSVFPYKPSNRTGRREVGEEVVCDCRRDVNVNIAF